MEYDKGTAATRAKNKYRDKTYDRIELTLPKGQKETIKAHAEAHSESVNGFINRAIETVMETDRVVPRADNKPLD